VLGDADVTALGIDPLDARSVILSALLGSHPPKLPARSLVALAERFSIRPGTIRTSLSRMVANGELDHLDGDYQLAGRLIGRQREQDAGRRAADEPWDGSWISVIVERDRRAVAERRAFRATMVGARMAELRPDIWLRPGNIDAPAPTPDVLVTRGSLQCDDVGDLVERLWPLDVIERSATTLHRALERQRPVIDAHDDATLPTTFVVAAAAVRFLRTEPQLPAELAPATWTPPSIRPLYDDFVRAFQQQLRAFFAATA
jgi:phenylacetic acid degradation operon negative regulatory protein